MIRESNLENLVHMTAMDKRILITKAIAEAHERLAKKGAFRRAFIATGTQLPADELSGSSIDLQGLSLDYKTICSASAVEAHKRVMEEEKRKAEAEKAKIEAELIASQRIIEAEKLILASRFQPAVERSSQLQPILKSLIH